MGSMLERSAHQVRIPALPTLVSMLTLSLILCAQYTTSIRQDIFVVNHVLEPSDSLPLLFCCFETRASLHSIAIFCACLAMSFGTEIVVFSESRCNKTHTPPACSPPPLECFPLVTGPARRASRKLLERMVE